MMAWSRGRTLAAGAAIIVLANAVALGGAWWNRQGEPESRLLLNERELVLPYRGYRLAENSGLALRLGWRVAAQRDIGAMDYYSGYAGSGGTPEWLDAARMRELGFDVAEADGGEEGRRRFSRQQAREVLLVLELAGPAWQQALERARENAARHEAAAAVNPDSKEFANRAKAAGEALRREEISNSRLFAVDAGADLAALRARYPDRTRFMIVRGEVRPQLVTRDKKMRLGGYIHDISVSRVNIPFALRQVIEGLTARPAARAGEEAPRYEVRLAIGHRLEPWIETLTPLPGVR